MSEQAYYSTTAWRPANDGGGSKRPRPQPDTRSRSFRMQWEAGRKLSKSYIPDLVPGDFLDLWRPRLEDKSVSYMDGEKGEKAPVSWMNHESFRWTTLPKFAWRWLLVKAIAKFILLAGSPLLFVTFLYIWWIETEHIQGYIEEAFLPTILYGGGACLFLWGGISLCERLFPDFMYAAPKGPLWEFNRRTGMVTVFCNPEKKGQSGKVQWQSPFEDFDCYVHMGPTTQGLPLYYAAMVNRYREESMVLTALHPASSNPGDHKAVWNFWCQYMDSTAPLPDIPLLEPHRANDPVTAAHDKETGRDPRYWYNMSNAAYEVKIKQMYQRCRSAFG